MGAAGTTVCSQINVPASANLDDSLRLFLKIHGLEYETQASVRVNNGEWTALNSLNVTLLGLASNFGGIGGGFSTLSMTMRLPLGLVVRGKNTVSFRFNGTDGNSSGFRVLSYDIQNASNGKSIADLSSFTQDDPAKWTAPYTDQANIAAGKNLYTNWALTQPIPGGSPKGLRAHCGDCHASDGRDLKYFNYSNHSIHQRAVFHGMSDIQADQIVSYIRSLNTPAPARARPWNPPYQPGPGLDSAPVSEWAAGAGLSAVLNSDLEMQPYVSPTLSAADFNPNGNLSVRNTPIPDQLLDWNHWLPIVHPIDGYGETFLKSAMYADYLSLSAALRPNDPANYAEYSYPLATWGNDTISFHESVPGPPVNNPAWNNPYTAQSIYGVSQWQVVKLWEFHQKFGLEGEAKYAFGPQAEARAWISNSPFRTSPLFIRIPAGVPGIHNGTEAAFYNTSLLWYYLQFILNSGNKVQGDNNPVDWQYLYNQISTEGSLSKPQALMYLTVLSKALQVWQNGRPPDSGPSGWNWSANDLSVLVRTPNMMAGRNIWLGMPVSMRTALLNAYVSQWLTAVNQWTPAQFFHNGGTTPEDSLKDGWSGGFAARMAFSVPRLHYLGLSDELTTKLANWAATMWPQYNWAGFAKAKCYVRSDSELGCPMSDVSP
jgi:hypothetical protein